MSLIKKKTGLLIRWAAKRSWPLSNLLLITFYPQHIYHVSYFFLTKKNQAFTADKLIRFLKHGSEKENNYRARVNEITHVISSDRGAVIEPDLSGNALSVEEFNNNVMFCLHNSAPYDFAGYWHRTAAIFSSLVPAGINISAVTRPGYPWDLIKHRQQPKVSSESIESVIIHRLSNDNCQYRQVTDSRYVHHYAIQVAAIAKQSQKSVIHGHSNYLNGLAASRAAKLMGVKSVYEARGLWHYTRLSKEPDYQHSDMFRYDDAMERMAMQQADAVVTLSSAMKSLIVTWGIPHEKVWVIPNAVDTDLFQPRQKAEVLRKHVVSDETFLIGFIGSLTIYEGLEDLISACVTLNNKGLNIHLAIIGSGPYENEIREFAAKHAFISCHERVPHNEVNDWYSIFDMCAYPRKADIVCQYVPPMKVLEAMAMGIPVLVSNLAPLVELVDGGKIGTICESNNVTSLIEKIEYMYHHPSDTAALAKKGIAWINDNRTWQRNASLYREMYQSLYHTRRPNE